jgi:SAM-dependent methyltransferase
VRVRFATGTSTSRRRKDRRGIPEPVVWRRDLTPCSVSANGKGVNSEEIRQKRAEVISKFGKWTSHNVYLAEDHFTYERSNPEFQTHLEDNGLRLNRYVQIAADLSKKPLNELRVLDLGCLEGLYAIEFARRGAQTVGIEGREANLAKAHFAKEILGLQNLRLEVDDVRNLSPEKYGTFDVVLCLGLLYHLDAPDVFRFVEQMASVCTGVAIIDTHVAVDDVITREYNGRTYAGSNFKEHDASATTTTKLGSLWASLDNDNSFWPTRPALYNLLADSGFTSAYSCHNPAVHYQQYHRDTIVAIKGAPVQVISTPQPDKGKAPPRWPRHSPSLSRPRVNLDGALSLVKGQIRRLVRKAQRS